MVAAFFDPNSSGQFQADLHAAMTDEVGASEADFNSSVLANIGDWEQTKQSVKQHGEETGSDHSDLLLKVGLFNGQIPADEVEDFVRKGTALPDDAVFNLAQAGQADTIAAQVDRGLAVNVNYQDPVSGANALGAYIQNAGYFPKKHDPEAAAEMVERLIAAGVEAKPPGGSFDPLDAALCSINTRNSNVMLAIAEALLAQGVPFVDSHRELLNKLPEGALRDQFLALFANSI